MNKIVIFGASVGGEKVYKMLSSIGVECVYFVDNASNKWGTHFVGKEIKSPNELKNDTYDIVIASVYYEEIEHQIIEMGISTDRIKTRESYIKAVLDQNIEKYRGLFSKTASENKEREIVIDLDHGILVGGIESWSFTIAKESIKSGIPTTIYTNQEEGNIPYGLERIVHPMDVSKESFEQEILNIANDMQKHLPCIFIANWMEQSFWAAYILKKLFPQDISVIGMVHHDMRGYYIRNQYISSCVDCFLCVSTDTRRKMINQYQISQDRVFYQPVPIDCMSSVEKKRRHEERLVIGMGARLDKAKKRVDLLVPLVEKLEERNLQYQLLIAGDGSYYNKLKKYIESNKLQNKVILFGELKVEEMKEFWRKVDVVISTSDSEGMGLAILEAMGAGALPVVTDTAGIREFVTDGVNGYVVAINDIEAMADIICRISDNRENMYEMGNKAADTIRAKCSVDGYIEFVLEIGNRME